MTKKRWLEYALSGLIIIVLLAILSQTTRHNTKADENDQCPPPADSATWLYGIQPVFAAGQDDTNGSICVNLVYNPEPSSDNGIGTTVNIFGSNKEDNCTGRTEGMSVGIASQIVKLPDHTTTFKVPLPVLTNPQPTDYYCVIGWPVEYFTLGFITGIKYDHYYCVPNKASKVMISRKSPRATTDLSYTCYKE